MAPNDAAGDVTVNVWLCAAGHVHTLAVDGAGRRRERAAAAAAHGSPPNPVDRPASGT